MSVPSSLDLASLLEKANEALARLHEHVAAMDRAAAQQPLSRPEEDVVELREKYQTVNRYIQFGDKMVQWIRSQTVLAVESQAQADAAAMIQRMKPALELAIQEIPSRELID